MLQSWEFNNEQEMLNYLVGFSYGPNPAEKMAEIRQEKKSNADFLVDWLELRSSDHVLEIGSGCGLISQFIAQKVEHLHCCDISQSFLDAAQKECAALNNISFHKTTSGSLGFLEDNSIDAAYSYNVFIHMQLFDIYLYLKELHRVMKPGANVWFDAAVTEGFRTEIPQIFIDMAEEHRQNPKALPGLMKWHSRSAIIALAKKCGLKLCMARLDDCTFVFTK
jgi:ubiquinone/menaquinone biosynthesis C-methylase UbiE